jgi:hypothetical protein
MRNEINEAQLPAARSLTRKERRKFQELGLDPALAKGNLNIHEINQKIIEHIEKEIYHIDGEEYDHIPNCEFVKLADKTYRMTYGMKDDIKN